MLDKGITSSTLSIKQCLGIVCIILLFLTTETYGETTYSITLIVTTQLPTGNVPMDPVIDFGKIINEERLPGVLDPNSIDCSRLL